jgi:hypothetical protein
MAVLLFPGVANAQAACAAGSTCVPPEDMKVFVQLLQAQKCRQETTPTMKTDPVTIVIDREGRIYGSGDDPHPYRAHIEWCNYQIDVTSQIQLVAAQQIEPDYGFRFRLKAAIGYLPVEAWSEKDAGRGIDGGVLLEPFFFRWANVNGYVGVRSFGAGIGFDATKNFGPYLGYSMAWGTWRSNVMAGLSFSLW